MSDLYDVAREVTDEVMGPGTYAAVNGGNSHPGVQRAIRNGTTSVPPYSPTQGGVGQRIREARALRGMSQRALATACRWPDDAGRISVYENNQRTPELGTLIVIAQALDVSAAWLAFGEV